MAKADLSERAIEAGERFLEKLDEFGLVPESAGWIYSDTLDEWRYIVATNAVEVVGRRRLYGSIIDIFDVFDFGKELTEADVHLVSPNEIWYQAMKGCIQVSGRSRAELQDVMLNGILVNAFVYRFFAAPSDAEIKKRVKAFSRNSKKALENAQK